MLTMLASAVVALALAPGATVVDWTVTPPLSGSVEGTEVLVESADGGSFPLAVIERPELGFPGWVVETEIRYEEVGGLGYLEMWSVFPDGSRFFTRTLGTEGPMAALSGDSASRLVQLPFSVDRELMPSRLEVNLVLPEGGTVWVGSLRLSSLPETTGAWWGDEASPLVGVAGSLVGMLGAAVGVLAGRRRGRRPVLAVMAAAAVLGLAGCALGLLAWWQGQPRQVVWPLLLLGILTAGLFGGLLPSVRARYVADELRRVQARDLVR